MNLYYFCDKYLVIVKRNYYNNILLSKGYENKQN